MDELSMLIMNGDAQAIKEYHHRKVDEAFKAGLFEAFKAGLFEAFKAGLFTGTESVRDSIAKILGFKTGKE